MSEPWLVSENQLQEQAANAIAELREKLANVQDVQAKARAVTGQARSADRTVTVDVDSTGVVTSIVFAPNAFDQVAPEKMAQTIVATIQKAATEARAKAAEALAPLTSESTGIFDAANESLPNLRASGLGVPAVPHTATDPTEDPNTDPDEAALRIRRGW